MRRRITNKNHRAVYLCTCWYLIYSKHNRDTIVSNLLHTTLTPWSSSTCRCSHTTTTCRKKQSVHVNKLICLCWFKKIHRITFGLHVALWVVFSLLCGTGNTTCRMNNTFNKGAKTILLLIIRYLLLPLLLRNVSAAVHCEARSGCCSGDEGSVAHDM